MVSVPNYLVHRGACIFNTHTQFLMHAYMLLPANMMTRHTSASLVKLRAVMLQNRVTHTRMLAVAPSLGARLNSTEVKINLALREAVLI